MQVREVSFKSGARNFNGYVALPNGGGPGVIVLHAWWGLTPFFRRFCEQLAGEGFTAFAPDLYSGRTAKTVEQAQVMLDTSDSAYAEAATLASVEQIKLLPRVSADRIGVVGFSMGAAWSLVLSAKAPESIVAAVLFYGSQAVDFSQSRAAVQGHFAVEDEWEPLDGIRMMEADLKAAGREYTFHFYPDAQHWFMEDDRGEYHADSANEAWQRTVEFLKEKLT